MIHPLAPDLDHVLEYTEGLWEELRGQRIFMTGGTGFIGCWLLESLLWANERLGLGARATVLTRDPGRFRSKAPRLASNEAVSLLAGDVKDFIFPTGSFSHLIHAATEVSTVVEDRAPLQLAATILDGTRRVLELGARCGAQKLLYTSSGAVYGPQPPGTERIHEECPLAPDPMDAGATYGHCKRTAEHLCVLHGAQSGVEIKIARGFAFAGPYLPLGGHFAVSNFVRDALRGGPVVVGGDGTAVRSYLYAADMAIWLWTVLCRGASGRPYNVGSEEAVTIRELAGTVAGFAGEACRVEVRGGGPKAGAGGRYVPSTERARSELSLRQRVSLSDAIGRTFQWHRGSVDGCQAREAEDHA